MRRAVAVLRIPTSVEIYPDLVALGAVLCLLPLARQALELAYPMLEQPDPHGAASVRSARSLARAFDRLERAAERHRRAVMPTTRPEPDRRQTDMF